MRTFLIIYLLFFICPYSITAQWDRSNNLTSLGSKSTSKLNASHYYPMVITTYDTFNGKVTLTYSYDNKGNVLSFLKELDNGYDERSTYTYDNYNNLLTYLLSHRFYDTVWVKEFRYTNTYDGNNNLLSSFWETWLGNYWGNNMMYTYTYDDNNNLMTQLTERWDNNLTAWQNISKLTYTYDNYHNALTLLQENWTTSEWVGSIRFTYTYDSSSNILTFIKENHNYNGWQNEYRVTNTYTDDRLITSQYENWQNNVWTNSVIYTYTYDLNGNNTVYLKQEWYGSEWLNSWTIHYIYNNNNKLLLETHMKWFLGAWQNNNRNTSEYDNNNNLTSYYGETWRDTVWEYSYKYKNVYDPNGNASHGEYFKWNNGWVSATGTFNMYSNNSLDTIGVNGAAVDIQYSTHTVIKPYDVDVNTFSLSQNYPNPFNPTTTIKFSIPKAAHVTLAIYNSLGQELKKLISSEMNAGDHIAEWNASGFTSGVYFYKLTAGDYTETKKLLLLK